MKAAFAGGGTGGHISPALAMAERVRSEGGECLFLVSFRSAPAFAARLAEFAWREIPSAPFRPGRPWTVPAAARSNWSGYRRSLRELREFAPDLLVATGGYPSLAAAFAARKLRIPLVLYDANTVPGRANRFLARYGGLMLRALPPDPGFLLKIPQVRVSPPVPAAARAKAPAGTAEAWGLDPEMFTVLVMGGSHGARGVNLLLQRCLGAWWGLEDKLQFIHVCGAGLEGRVEEAYREAGFRARVFPFAERMGWLYSLADLVVARSGAASVAEIVHWGRPAILVPYPWAADAHQEKNARYLESAGAAEVCSEGEEAPARLAAAVEKLLSDPARLEGMRAAARAAAAGSFSDILEVLAAAARKTTG